LPFPCPFSPGFPVGVTPRPHVLYVSYPSVSVADLFFPAPPHQGSGLIRPRLVFSRHAAFPVRRLSSFSPPYVCLVFGMPSYTVVFQAFCHRPGASFLTTDMVFVVSVPRFHCCLTVAMYGFPLPSLFLFFVASLCCQWLRRLYVDQNSNPQFTHGHDLLLSKLSGSFAGPFVACAG